MIPGIKTALGDMNEFENLNQRDQEAKVRAYIYGAHGPGKITLIDGAHRWANSAGFPWISERLTWHEFFNQK